MKKLLFSTLALAAVVVASPVLANDGFVQTTQGEDASLDLTPKAPATNNGTFEGNFQMGNQDDEKDQSNPVHIPSLQQPTDGRQPAPVENGVTPKTPVVGEGYLEVVIENGVEVPYWVIKRENGEDRVRLSYKVVKVTNPDGTVSEKKELVMPENLISGPEGKDERGGLDKGDKKSEDNKSEEKKSEEKAVKDAMKAAKKDAAKKDGKKVLPNTSAVK